MSWIIRQNHWDICSTGQPAGESSSCEKQEACLFQQHLQQRWEQLGRFHFSWAALSTGNHSHWVFNRKHGGELSGGLGVILTSQKNLTAPSPGRWELASPCTRELPAHCKARSQHLRGLVICSRVPQQCSEGVVPYYQQTFQLLVTKQGLNQEPSASQPRTTTTTTATKITTAMKLILICAHRLAPCRWRWGDDKKVSARGVKNIMGLYPQGKSTELQGIHL